MLLPALALAKPKPDATYLQPTPSMTWTVPAHVLRLEIRVYRAPSPRSRRLDGRVSVGRYCNGTRSTESGSVYECAPPDADPSRAYAVRLFDRWGERISLDRGPAAKSALVCQHVSAGWECAMGHEP